MRQTLTQKARGVGDVIVHIQRHTGVEQVVLRDIQAPREAVTIINRVAHDARLASHTLANTHHYTSGFVPASAPPPSAPTHESRGADNPMEQLVKLGQLRDAGVLTQDEFAAKKAEILSRL